MNLGRAKAREREREGWDAVKALAGARQAAGAQKDFFLERAGSCAPDLKAGR